MANKPPFGQLIDRIHANKIMGKQDEITGRVKKILVPVLDYPNQAPSDDDEKAPATARKLVDLNYYDNKFNGFVFDKSLIDKLFEPGRSEIGDLDCLVVILAAEKDNAEKKMRPTVILAACTSVVEKEKIRLVTPNTNKPGAETPPKVILSKLPLVEVFPGNKKAGEKALVFSIE